MLCRSADVKIISLNHTADVLLEVATLGVDDAFFAMQTDRKYWFDLKNNYKVLEGVMEDLHGIWIINTYLTAF